MTMFSSPSYTTIDSSVMEASSIFSERASTSGSTKVSSIGLEAGGSDFASYLGVVFFVSTLSFLAASFCFSLDSF